MLQLEILQYADISILGRIRCIELKYGRILRGGSKAPHRWFIDPTHVGPMSQKKFFFTSIFQPLPEIISMRIEGEMIIIHAKFWSFAS